MPDDDLARNRVESEDDQVNVLGDQDAENTSGYQYPPGAELPTAQNVRRYPELFDQSVIDSFEVKDPNDADADVLDESFDETTITPAPEAEPDTSGHITT